jgi:hypothetical protein
MFYNALYCRFSIEYLQKIESSTLKDFNLARTGEAIKREQALAHKKRIEK